MYKEAWGLKRICPMCSKQYYDLGRTELECPECGKKISPLVAKNAQITCSRCSTCFYFEDGL